MSAIEHVLYSLLLSMFLDGFDRHIASKILEILRV